LNNTRKINGRATGKAGKTKGRNGWRRSLFKLTDFMKQIIRGKIDTQNGRH